MDSYEKAIQTQISNIEAKTGKSLAELFALVEKSPLKKYGELRQMLMTELGLGHGDANTVLQLQKQSKTEDKSLDTVVDDIYSGSKEPLKPLHEKAMTAIHKLGEFEIAPKKTYLSLRRKKQFATVGPGSKGRLEIGLNMKGVEETSRLEMLPPGKMCQYRIFVTQPEELDKDVMGWIKTAFDSAG